MTGRTKTNPAALKRTNKLYSALLAMDEVKSLPAHVHDVMLEFARRAENQRLEYRDLHAENAELKRQMTKLVVSNENLSSAVARILEKKL